MLNKDIKINFTYYVAVTEDKDQLCFENIENIYSDTLFVLKSLSLHLNKNCFYCLQKEGNLEKSINEYKASIAAMSEIPDKNKLEKDWIFFEKSKENLVNAFCLFTQLERNYGASIINQKVKSSTYHKRSAIRKRRLIKY